MTSPKYMFWLIEQAWGYMRFNIEIRNRQGWDTRKPRCGAALREFWRLDWEERFRYRRSAAVARRARPGPEFRAGFELAFKRDSSRTQAGSARATLRAAGHTRNTEQHERHT